MLKLKTAIILLSYNNIENTTKPCVERIYKVSTNVPFELVIVDNLSTDGTRDYLEQVKLQHDTVRVIMNDQNYGYAKGNNIGIASTEADYYILLNSDTIVTDFWLDKLISFLEQHQEIGLVGPVSNCVGNEQIIHASGSTEPEILLEGCRWAEMCCDDYFITDTLGFFCVVISRKIIDAVGLLDESYGLGTFEDYDYCYRVKQAGYDLACLEDVFVYHKGSVSFRTAKIDTNKLFIENMALFESKHNVKWRSGHTVEPFIKLIENYVNCMNPENMEKSRYKLLNKLEVVNSLGFPDLYRDYLKLYMASLDNKENSSSVQSAELELLQIKSSLTWRLASKFHRVLDRFIAVFRRDVDVSNTNSDKESAVFSTYDNDQFELQKIIETHPCKYLIVFLPLIDWDLPLYQRPQQLALQFAKDDFLYFYCTPNMGYDQVSGFKKIGESCYVTNRADLLLNHHRKKIIHMYSTDLSINYEFVESEISKGNAILYEYMDEIDSSISNVRIPPHVLSKHEKILKNPKCLVVATADNLYQEVLRNRTINCAQITNGVEVSHFSKIFDKSDIPEELAPILAKNAVVIGYFGALASWFDFELVLGVAKARPEWAILLIGWSYDNAIDRYDLSQLQNLYVLGPIDYQRLPQYAFWFSVSIIPFRINDVTKSTSPIKLFEYMALGKPIVTTDLPECRKYESAIIANDEDDFIAKIEYALTLKNNRPYQEMLRTEASKNAWELKGWELSCCLKEYLATEKISLFDPEHDKWALVVAECQTIISDMNARSHYINAYKKEELFYWYHIARWSYEDATLNRIENVLDIGSAYGTIALYAKKLFDCNVFCTDVHDRLISPDLVGKYQFNFSINNIELEPLSWGFKFDRIYLTEVLEHFNFSPLPTLQKIRAALADNGKLYLSTPDAAEWGKVEKYYSYIDVMPMPNPSMEIIDDHIYQYSKDELISLLIEAGFRIDKFDYSYGQGLRHFNLVASKDSRDVINEGNKPVFSRVTNPKVSIVLPVYNQAEFIAASIASVLDQTYQNIELIIVSDGSTDGLENVLAEFDGDTRVTVIHQDNLKLPTALNNGFKVANGDYFSWTSADNILLPDQIEVLLDYLQNNLDKGFVYSNYQLIGDDGEPFRECVRGYQSNDDLSIIILPDVVTEENFHDSRHNFIGASFLYRRVVAQVVGDYAVDLFAGEDYDYFLRMHNLFKFGHVEHVLYKYRVHANTITAKYRDCISGTSTDPDGLKLLKNIQKVSQRDNRRRAFIKSDIQVIKYTNTIKGLNGIDAPLIMLYSYDCLETMSEIDLSQNGLVLHLLIIDIDQNEVKKFDFEKFDKIIINSEIESDKSIEKVIKLSPHILNATIYKYWLFNKYVNNLETGN